MPKKPIAVKENFLNWIWKPGTCRKSRGYLKAFAHLKNEDKFVKKSNSCFIQLFVSTRMPWGVSTEKKKEMAEPSVSERDVLIFNINEISNDTLESTRSTISIGFSKSTWF